MRGIIARRADEQQLQATGAARQAIDFMVRRGTVAVGDIANGSWVVPLLRRSALHGVIFHEVLGPRRAAAEELIERAVSRLEALADDLHKERHSCDLPPVCFSGFATGSGHSSSLEVWR